MNGATVAERRATFRRLHESGCFVIPNPWDAGSARFLESLGFPALATTSSGIAWSLAAADNEVDRDTMLARIAAIVDATALPVNADFENGYADDPAGVADSVRLAVATGVAGLSIEDSTRAGAAEPLYPLELAVERIGAARRAIDATGEDVLLTGRSEGFIAGRPDLDATIERLRAYAAAGADCVYAPGIRTREQVHAIVRAVAPTPVNVLTGWAADWTITDLAALGVRRISVGGALARTAWAGFERAARELAEVGRFDAFGEAASGADLDAFFARTPESAE